MFDEEIIMYVKVNINNVIHRVLYRTEKINKKFFQSISLRPISSFLFQLFPYVPHVLILLIYLPLHLYYTSSLQVSQCFVSPWYVS
jgi:hypothetical protein